MMTIQEIMEGARADNLKRVAKLLNISKGPTRKADVIAAIAPFLKVTFPKC